MLKTCFICQKVYNKGISICCSRQCHNKRINVRNRDNDICVLNKLKRIEEYKLNPSLCKQCHNPLDWKIKNNTYCSRSCSAITNNKNKSKETIAKQAETLRKTLSNKPKKPTKSKSKIRFKICPTCKESFQVLNRMKYCSLTCKAGKEIKTYRRACAFNITNKNYPELFDIDLLRSYGWYRAGNHPKGYNPNGATWDHLFRIEDGFKLGIAPEIMSHPANAQMVSWKENFSRKKSTISYEELLIRIKEFGGVADPRSRN